MVDLQLFAQGRPVDTENIRRKRLIALSIIHHRCEQRWLDLTHHQAVEFGRFVAIQVLQIRL